MRRPPWSKIMEGKRHEMFKSRPQAAHWSCRSSARLVQQAGANVQSIAAMRSWLMHQNYNGLGEWE